MTVQPLTTTTSVQIVEVGPRDGFQAIDAFIPTDTKCSLIRALHAAGIRRLEATAFVGKNAVPQLADAQEVLAVANGLSGMDVQVLVPNERNTDRALSAGARHIAYVLSVSERHNQSNVRRSVSDSVSEFAQIIGGLDSCIKVRLNVATAFDCPYDGPVAPELTLSLLEQLVGLCPSAEVALCDTTGRSTPNRVTALFDMAIERFPQISSWAYHGHDTFGLGLANVNAVWRSGVRVFDASVAGLGGCPFAPGATGNVATEDVMWMFEQMGVDTGIDLDRLMVAARAGATLPGATPGGRVREALSGRLCSDRLRN